MLDNMLGPIFNTTLDQFYTVYFCIVWCYVFVCNFERHTKKENALFVSTLVLTNIIVKMSVICFFSAYFILSVFGISKFWRDVFWWVSKHQNITKPQRTTNKKQQENRKQRQIKSILVFQNKTRQQAETTKEHLETNIKQNQKQKARTQNRNQKETLNQL